MILLSRDIHENGNNKDYISSGFEAILYRIYNTRKVLLIKFDEFRIIIYNKKVEIVKYS